MILSTRSRYYRALNLTPELAELLALPVPMDFYQLLGLDFDEVHAKPLIINGTGINPLSSLFGLDGSSLSSVDVEGGSASSGAAGGGTFEQRVKGSYRRLQKLVHPDRAGEAATEMAALVNLAFRTLSDPDSRAAYDLELRSYRKGVGAFDGRPVSFWAGPEGETRAIFVSEEQCIGCMQCTMVAPNTFFMEEEWGRARVHTQWGDTEEFVMEAVGACPVDCIYITDRQQLPLLEYVMKSCKRENVALMGRRRSGNMGSGGSIESPFVKAETFLRHRKNAKVEQVLAAGTARMQDDELAAAISRAWLSLPSDVRDKGWPEWAGMVAAAEAEVEAAQQQQQSRGTGTAPGAWQAV